MTTVKAEKEKLLNNPDFQQDPWAFFDQELNAWGREGVIAEFWWRDDDATTLGPQLDRLLSFADQSPMTLAVIPKLLKDDLEPKLRDYPNVDVAQHGYQHENHAPEGEKKAEFRDHRPTEAMQEDLYEGAVILKKAFGDQFQPLFVPPWNRIGKAATEILQEMGIDFLSTFTPRQIGTGPEIINTHIDPVNWKEGRSFLGEAESLTQAILHLQAKREGWPNIDVIEPSGFLTHHAIHNEEVWAFVTNFNKVIQQHPAARWISLSTYIDSYA